MMRIWIHIILLLFVMCLNCQRSQAWGNRQKTREVELELLFSFPTQKQVNNGIYLNEAQNFSCDLEGNIYISLLKEQQILKFREGGEFITRIGRSGQGPGEFQGPGKTFIWNNNLFVLDNFRRKLQIFDPQNNYLDGFQTQKGYWDFAVTKSGLICGASIFRHRDNNLNQTDIINQKGELIRSFGQTVDFEHSYTVYNMTRIAANDSDEIYLAFFLWPIIRKFSLDGEFKAEYTIDHKAMRENTEFNRQYQKAPKKSGQATTVKNVINDIELLGNVIYLLDYSFSIPRLEILELDNDLAVEVVYYFKTTGVYRTWDFLIREREGELFFYVLQISPENRVDVFGIKKNKI